MVDDQGNPYVADETAFMELPKYLCHKEVHALKIKDVVLMVGEGNGARLTPADDLYVPFVVTEEYVQKHQPVAGGYYVVYKDGYKSFSPAEAFEDGYTLIKT